MKVYYIKNDKCVDLTPRLPELDDATKEKLLKLGLASIFIFEATTTNVYAATNISSSVQPLIDVLIDLAEPVSYGFMVKGFIEWMTGRENEGKKTIKSSMTGYLGIKFIPQIFKIIKGINLAG